MGARLIDVAEAAGVSRGTASNVFNNPDLVRPELRERVLAAARSLGYLGPDARGRLLRSGKFNTIGVMSPSDWGIADMLDNPVFRLFLAGVGQAVGVVGEGTRVHHHRNDRPSSRDRTQALAGQHPLAAGWHRGRHRGDLRVPGQ